ncbi:hypothetical protein [Sporomusa acidovorans]|uniref:hypothetical protein n=1 Tax=Sporomusa acidovorans TaxID=112900 RepID=UPI0015A15A14|nr:hypothetical protein [Sporomusa acidovorans]
MVKCRAIFCAQNLLAPFTTSSQSAAMQEVAAASQALARMAEELHTALAEFKI